MYYLCIVIEMTMAERIIQKPVFTFGILSFPEVIEEGHNHVDNATKLLKGTKIK